MQSSPKSPLGLKILIAVTAGCLILAVGFLFLKTSRSSKSAQRLVAVGTLSSLIGEADHRLPQALEFEPLIAGDSIFAGETIVIRHASEATLAFDGGGSIRLQPGAKFVAERDSSGREGSVLGTVIEGDVKVVSLGAAGSLRILKEGKPLTSQSVGEVAPVIPSPNRFSKPAAAESLIVTATTPIETPTPSPRDQRGETIGGTAKATGESLGNDEIRKSIRGNSGFIQRCYLTYLNRVKPEPTNRVSVVTVGFVISNSGKVREAKIVRSDFTDATLNNCVLETLERTSFRPFRGTDIPVLEFPIELQ